MNSEPRIQNHEFRTVNSAGTTKLEPQIQSREFGTVKSELLPQGPQIQHRKFRTLNSEL